MTFTAIELQLKNTTGLNVGIAEGLTPSYTTLYHPLVKMHRTNLSLLPRHMKRLEEERKKTGASTAELVRRAIDNTYPEKAQAKTAAR